MDQTEIERQLKHLKAMSDIFVKYMEQNGKTIELERALKASEEKADKSFEFVLNNHEEKINNLIKGYKDLSAAYDIVVAANESQLKVNEKLSALLMKLTGKEPPSMEVVK